MAEHTKLEVILMPLTQFRYVNEIGIHRIFENTHDLDNAIDQALKDGFNSIYLYTSTPSVNLLKPYMEQFWDVYDSQRMPGIAIEIYI